MARRPPLGVGEVLADKPLMQNVVADLAVESEAATALAIRLAAAVDRIDNPHEAALRRIALPLAKFWVCKRTPGFVAEALECLGGNGYVEDSGLPLLYREAPLNSVWEGSGNVNALDVLRALGREPEVLAAWITEVGQPAAPTRGSTAPSTTPSLFWARRARTKPAPAGSPDGPSGCSCRRPPRRGRQGFRGRSPTHRSVPRGRSAAPRPAPCLPTHAADRGGTQWRETREAAAEIRELRVELATAGLARGRTALTLPRNVASGPAAGGTSRSAGRNVVTAVPACDSVRCAVQGHSARGRARSLARAVTGDPLERTRGVRQRRLQVGPARVDSAGGPIAGADHLLERGAVARELLGHRVDFAQGGVESPSMRLNAAAPEPAKTSALLAIRRRKFGAGRGRRSPAARRG